MRKILVGIAASVLVLVSADAGFCDDSGGILKTSGIEGGFVVHLGCADGKLTAALKFSDAYVVHGLDADATKVRVAREAFLAGKLGGTVSAAVFDGEHLPYVDGMVNLVVIGSRFKIPQAELLRVLAPNGVILERAGEGWKKTVKPVPDQHDDWTHYLRAPDNNSVSEDTAIAAPIRSLQWKGGPKYSRHHDKSSSVPAVVTTGGRLFYIVDEGPRASILWDSDWKLVARDAYNGVVLWKRKIDSWTDQLWPLKSGPSNTPRRLVAVGDAVYATLGLMSPVSKLDAVTGKTLAVYKGTEHTEEIIVADGVLYLVVNPAIEAGKRGGFWTQKPKTVMAVSESNGNILWRHELPWIAPVTLTAGDKKVYLCTGPQIVAFDCKSGKELWKSEKLPWREKKMPTYFAPTLVAAGKNVLYAGGENWREHAGSKGKMTCLDSATGKIKWQAPHLPSGYQSPQDIFVIGNSVWCGSLNSKPGEFDRRYPEVSPSTGEFISYDLETGKPGRTIPRGADCYWFHHRCHRAKATTNFFLTSRTGIEMIDINSGKWSLHHWTRGACAYGVMPANGLIYGPPHPCACYPEAKLSGFNALSGPRKPTRKPLQAKDRLLKGPAFGEVPKSQIPNSKSDDWPAFRQGPARNGSTPAAMGPELTVKWATEIAGRLSQPIVAAGKLFVSAVDAHTVYALDQASGKVQWSYIAGGRVDSPPTYYKGTVIFGSADGYVYCLRASDGALVWRFAAAPYDQRLMIYGQLESLWPVHGSVLIRDDVAYVIAGRSMFLDGGLTLYRMNPATGEIISQKQMDQNDPNTGKDLHSHVKMLDMPVASTDILSSEGKYVFMRSLPLDLKGNRIRVEHVNVSQQKGDDAHLFVPNGFLDDNYWHRAFWVYGRSVLGGPGYGGTGHKAPSGKIMILDADNMYIFGRQQKYWRWTVPLEYRLFSVARSVPKPEIKPPVGGKKPRRGRQPAFAPRWSVNIPILARAMVKAGDVVFACGPEDIVDETTAQMRQPAKLDPLKKQAELFTGSEGSLLFSVSSKDGSIIGKTKLDVLPVFDGMISAGGKLYMSTVDGKVVCMESDEAKAK